MKMRATTKRCKKVEDLLYSTFRGNAATRYGSAKEAETIQQYVTYQKNHGHPDLTVAECGLFVSTVNPWLAASPDGSVHDPGNGNHPQGIIEIKNPYSVRDKSLTEAYTSSGFCLERKNNVYKLKVRHDYFFQIQCQLYCTDRNWCDFIVRTNKDIHIERVYRDKVWWEQQLDKARVFFFTALLPELACPRHRKDNLSAIVVSHHPKSYLANCNHNHIPSVLSCKLLTMEF